MPRVTRRLRSKTDPTKTVTCLGHRTVKAIGPILAIMACLSHLPDTWDLNVVEYFSGVQSVTNGCAQQGPQAVPYDVNLDTRLDMTSSVGFLHAVELALRIRPAGMAFFAPPCSSFVWVNRYTSGRSSSSPEGHRDRPHVQSANLIVVRCCILIMILVSKGCMWCLEQPASSVMKFLPCFQDICGFHKVTEVFTYMGAFGAATMKPTRLYSNCQAAVLALKRTMSSSKCLPPPSPS